MPLYIGEASGGRVLVIGAGLSSVGTNHQGAFQTWELTPSGEMGDNVFRSLGVSFVATNGWSIGITPYIDGVSLGESVHGGSGATANGQAQRFVHARGTRISVSVRTLSRTGDIAFSNVQASCLPLRAWP